MNIKSGDWLVSGKGADADYGRARPGSTRGTVEVHWVVSDWREMVDRDDASITVVMHEDEARQECERRAALCA